MNMTLAGEHLYSVNAEKMLRSIGLSLEPFKTYGEFATSEKWISI